jgi:hypothetical protein
MRVRSLIALSFFAGCAAIAADDTPRVAPGVARSSHPRLSRSARGRPAAVPDIGGVWTVEFPRDQLPIPRQNRFRLGYRRDLPQCLASESLADFRQSRPLRVGIDQARRAGLEKSTVLNCLSWQKLSRLFNR